MECMPSTPSSGVGRRRARQSSTGSASTWTRCSTRNELGRHVAEEPSAYQIAVTRREHEDASVFELGLEGSARIARAREELIEGSGAVVGGDAVDDELIAAGT